MRSPFSASPFRNSTGGLFVVVAITESLRLRTGGSLRRKQAKRTVAPQSNVDPRREEQSEVKGASRSGRPAAEEACRAQLVIRLAGISSGRIGTLADGFREPG